MADLQEEILGELEDQSVIEVIREIYNRRASGTLELEREGRRRWFHFEEGELCLPASHPLSARLAEYLEVEQRLRSGDEVGAKSRAEASSEAREALEMLVERIVAVLVEWRTGRYQFSDRDDADGVELVGPLPTAYLIMEGAVYQRSEDELLEKLGGEKGRLAATGDTGLLTRLYGIDPEQMFLLSRAEEPRTVGELLRQVSLDRTEALRKLCRLHAVGALRSLPPATVSDRSTAESELLLSLAQRLGERIASQLERHPVDLDAEEHRERLELKLRDLGGQTHYEVLQVDMLATEEEIHAAYQELGRLAHPSHATALGLEGKDAGLKLLFERATMAYLTLVDPDRRAAYNSRVGLGSLRSSSHSSRSEEQHGLAEEAFTRARACFEAHDYHYALELTERAIRAVPEAHYYALRGAIEAQNPYWLQRSVQSYREAIRLDPGNAEHRIALGKVQEQCGDVEEARLQYHAVLADTPDHPEARAGLERLGAVGSPIPRDDSGSLPVPAPLGRPRYADTGARQAALLDAAPLGPEALPEGVEPLVPVDTPARGLPAETVPVAMLRRQPGLGEPRPRQRPLSPRAKSTRAQRGLFGWLRRLLSGA